MTQFKDFDNPVYPGFDPTVPEDRALDVQIARDIFEYWDIGMYEGQLVHGETNMNGWPMVTPRYTQDLGPAVELVQAVHRELVVKELEDPEYARDLAEASIRAYERLRAASE